MIVFPQGPSTVVAGHDQENVGWPLFSLGRNLGDAKGDEENEGSGSGGRRGSHKEFLATAWR